MDYYISETPLRLREFGRNIQAMVEYAKTIEDKEARTRVANEIIRIMSNLKPSIKDIPDYKQKLWDAIFMISDYDFDVEAPFDMPLPPEKRPKDTEHMPYYDGRPRYRQYGWNVQLMVHKAIDMQEGPARTAYLNQIANAMRQFLRTGDRESTPEEIIADQMKEMSKGRLVIDPNELTITRQASSHHHHSNHHHSSSNGKSRNNKRGNNRGGGKRRRKN
ncbi:MAG: DUF4290 domain-containing protein [Bacteroidota bacterium]